VQKDVEIATALETVKKEGYILGCQERLETARQVVNIMGGMLRQLSMTFTGYANTNTESTTVLPIASAIHILCEVDMLQSSSPNPWGSLSQQHHHSHLCKLSVHVHHHPFHYTMDNHTDVTPIPSPSSIHTVETVQHPYGIGSPKPVIRLGAPIHHIPFIPGSIAQLYHIMLSHYISPRFIQGIVSCSLSICS
jgi:hypothetical protein